MTNALGAAFGDLLVELHNTSPEQLNATGKMSLDIAHTHRLNAIKNKRDRANLEIFAEAHETFGLLCKRFAAKRPAP